LQLHPEQKLTNSAHNGSCSPTQWCTGTAELFMIKQFFHGLLRGSEILTWVFSNGRFPIPCSVSKRWYVAQRQI